MHGFGLLHELWHVSSSSFWSHGTSRCGRKSLLENTRGISCWCKGKVSADSHSVRRTQEVKGKAFLLDCHQLAYGELLVRSGNSRCPISIAQPTFLLCVPRVRLMLGACDCDRNNDLLGIATEQITRVVYEE